MSATMTAFTGAPSLPAGGRRSIAAARTIACFPCFSKTCNCAMSPRLRITCSTSIVPDRVLVWTSGVQSTSAVSSFETAPGKGKRIS